MKPNNKMKCEDKQNNVNVCEILSDDNDDDTEEECEEEQRLAEHDENR